MFYKEIYTAYHRYYGSLLSLDMPFKWAYHLLRLLRLNFFYLTVISATLISLDDMTKRPIERLRRFTRRNSPIFPFALLTSAAVHWMWRQVATMPLEMPEQTKIFTRCIYLYYILILTMIWVDADETARVTSSHVSFWDKEPGISMRTRIAWYNRLFYWFELQFTIRPAGQANRPRFLQPRWDEHYATRLPLCRAAEFHWLTSITASIFSPRS